MVFVLAVILPLGNLQQSNFNQLNSYTWTINSTVSPAIRSQVQLDNTGVVLNGHKDLFDFKKISLDFSSVYNTTVIDAFLVSSVKYDTLYTISLISASTFSVSSYNSTSNTLFWTTLVNVATLSPFVPCADATSVAHTIDNNNSFIFAQRCSSSVLSAIFRVLSNGTVDAIALLPSYVSPNAMAVDQSNTIWLGGYSYVSSSMTK